MQDLEILLSARDHTIKKFVSSYSTTPFYFQIKKSEVQIKKSRIQIKKSHIQTKNGHIQIKKGHIQI